MPSPWMRVSEAAEYIRRSEKTIYRMIEERKITAYYPDRLPLIKQTDLDKYVESHVVRASR